MSEYMKLKAQIDELTAKLEATRVAEMEAEVTDMKKRIVAFGIRPEQLFSAEDLKGPQSQAQKQPRVRQPPRYALNGHTWSGRGAPPNWYRQALAEGKQPADMLLKGAE